MRKTVKILTGMLAASAVLAGSALTAFAADTISSISIRMAEEKQEAGVVWTAEPTVSSNDYYISEYEWSTDYDSWEPGKSVSVQITLESDEKNFKKDASVSVSNGSAASSSRSSTSKYKVKVNYIPRVILSMPEGVWYEDEYTLEWDKVEYAGGYEVKLYKDGSSYKTIKVDGRSNTTADLSEYATDDYLITAAVRAVAPSGKTSYITASDWYEVDGEGVSASGASTVFGTFTGSGSSKRFSDEDGGYASGWKCVNGYWYYFDPANNDYASANKWMDVDGSWYYFDEDGRMLSGWAKIGDYWYYFNEDTTGSAQPYGAMVRGWVHTGPNSPWYYLSDGISEGYPDGAMLADTTTPDGYYVDNNGAWNG